MELVDPRLGTEFNEEEAIRMTKVALLCTNSSPALRPTMSEVVNMLERRTFVPELIMDPSIFANESRFGALKDQFNRMKSWKSSETTMVTASSDSSSTPCYWHMISNPMTYGKVQLDDDDDVTVMVRLHQSSNNNMVEMYVETTNTTYIPTSSVPARRTEESDPSEPHTSDGDDNFVGRFGESLAEFSEDDEYIIPLVDDDDTPLVDESDVFEDAS
ncbi:hypothetical protein F3Y22_tig00001799pilonHSYRG00027 [Hibiscus syriacus]|uniref:Uncharacterized protein n=1 Tax=Hibiscus syriacus TaxID=106335 RepID=A0A6A3CT31_HIBSY|nr:hypothetical protein F3Y22_tig00001799pilonHSYRG00027 [Hibiscus syriacus]